MQNVYKLTKLMADHHEFEIKPLEDWPVLSMGYDSGFLEILDMEAEVALSSMQAEDFVSGEYTSEYVEENCLDNIDAFLDRIFDGDLEDNIKVNDEYLAQEYIKDLERAVKDLASASSNWSLYVLDDEEKNINKILSKIFDRGV